MASYHCPHFIVKCYGSIDELNIHVDKCLNIDEVDRIKIDVVCECPVEGKNTLKFINNGRAFKHPFHVIADFESTLEKCDEKFINKDDEDIKTNQTQKHIQTHSVLNIIVFIMNIQNRLKYLIVVILKK